MSIDFLNNAIVHFLVSLASSWPWGWNDIHYQGRQCTPVPKTFTDQVVLPMLVKPALRTCLSTYCRQMTLPCQSRLFKTCRLWKEINYLKIKINNLCCFIFSWSLNGSCNLLSVRLFVCLFLSSRSVWPSPSQAPLDPTRVVEMVCSTQASRPFRRPQHLPWHSPCSEWGVPLRWMKGGWACFVCVWVCVRTCRHACYLSFKLREKV